LPAFGKETTPQLVGNAGDMPMVALGDKKISSLITGSNTINAGSHLSHLVNRSMKEYFDRDNTIEFAKKNNFFGLAHHGEVTDWMYKSGELDKIEDFLKKIRDAGILVGISTHMPEVVDFVESKGWDIDFYMCCVYERHRSAEDLKKN
jgi:hypothetical protein